MSYDKDNILVRPIPYKILRNIHLSDGGSYHVQMDLKAGIDEELAEKVIEVMHEQGLLYRVENTDPQLYDVNYSKFEEIWKSLWIEEVGDVPVEPVHFATFIEHYVEAYFEEVQDSDIKEMLVTEFYFGLVHENDLMIPESYQELRNHLEEKYGGSKNSSKIIERGMDKID